jgi:hypothetical protein
LELGEHTLAEGDFTMVEQEVEDINNLASLVESLELGLVDRDIEMAEQKLDSTLVSLGIFFGASDLEHTMNMMVDICQEEDNMDNMLMEFEMGGASRYDQLEQVKYKPDIIGMVDTRSTTDICQDVPRQ